MIKSRTIQLAVPLICLAILILIVQINLNMTKSAGVFTAQDTAKEIAVKRSENIAVELPENPSTGFFWRYQIEDEAMIIFVMDKFVPANSEPNQVGFPGTRIFRFRAVKPGATSIKFMYYREGEAENVLESLLFTFMVD